MALRLVSTLALSVIVGGCAGQSLDYGGVSVEQGPSRVARGEIAAARADDAIALIRTDVGRGMGFVVDPTGYLITNRHVLEDADVVEEVTFPAMDPPLSLATVQVAYMDPRRDLALLKVETDRPLPYLKVATRATTPVARYLSKADPVTLFETDHESDEDVGLTRHAGAVSTLGAQNRAAGPGAFVGLTQDVREGQSGGPVLDRYGRVVGVVTWTWRHRRGGYAIPIGDATRMLAERPVLDDRSRQMARARQRVHRFLSALGANEIDAARRMTSPSHAKEVRAETVEQIASTTEDEESTGMQMFLLALEGLAKEESAIDDQAVFDRLQELVVRTGSDEFREALGVGHLGQDQVLAFFFELGQSYLQARRFGHKQPGEALEAALKRLYTVDAARTFAFAGLIKAFGGNQVEIESIEVVPGAYAPQAIVTLRTAAPVAEDSGDGMKRAVVQSSLRGARLAMHLRLEWGDWYVADVTPAA